MKNRSSARSVTHTHTHPRHRQTVSQNTRHSVSLIPASFSCLLSARITCAGASDQRSPTAIITNHHPHHSCCRRRDDDPRDDGGRGPGLECPEEDARRRPSLVQRQVFRQKVTPILILVQLFFQVCSRERRCPPSSPESSESTPTAPPAASPPQPELEDATLRLPATRTVLHHARTAAPVLRPESRDGRPSTPRSPAGQVTPQSHKSNSAATATTGGTTGRPVVESIASCCSSSRSRGCHSPHIRWTPASKHQPLPSHVSISSPPLKHHQRKQQQQPQQQQRQPEQQQQQPDCRRGSAADSAGDHSLILVPRICSQ